MPFFQFVQNNSGGNFEADHKRGISHYVIVEAENAEEANSNARDIGLYFDGRRDCSCCGHRWWPQFEDDEGDPEPMVYNHVVSHNEAFSEATGNIKWIDGPEGYIHYEDNPVPIPFWE